MWWYDENEIEIHYYESDFHPMDCYHVHENEEVVLVKYGVSTIITENRLESVSGAYMVRYPAGVAHQQHNDPDAPFICYTLRYTADCLDGILPADRCSSDFCVLPLSPGEFEKLEAYAKPLTAAYQARDADTDTLRLRRRYLLALLRSEIAWLESNNKRILTKDSGPIQEICRYIREHCTEPLTLDGIAAHFYISRSKLVRSFRAVLNMSVYEYICRARIGSSLSMLREGKSVKEVAIACGFSSAEYYTKVFRKKVGCAPSEYRTNNMKP